MFLGHRRVQNRDLEACRCNPAGEHLFNNIKAVVLNWEINCVLFSESDEKEKYDLCFIEHFRLKPHFASVLLCFCAKQLSGEEKFSQQLANMKLLKKPKYIVITLRKIITSKLMSYDRRKNKHTLPLVPQQMWP